jgi:hypothetical protein
MRAAFAQIGLGTMRMVRQESVSNSPNGAMAQLAKVGRVSVFVPRSPQTLKSRQTKRPTV